MNTEILLQQIINGLVVGSIYALIALGYTMVYGILQLINFAHGEIVMIGAMLTITMVQVLLGIWPGIPGPLALGFGLLLAIPLTMLLGYLIERIAYRPLRRAPRLAPLITAIGVSIVLQQAAMLIWGRNYRPFPPVLPDTLITFHGASVTALQIAIVVLTGLILAGLFMLIERTRMGRAMRATAQSPDMARLMGVNVNAVISTTFMIGSALAAIAGVMVAANYDQAHSYMGFLIGLKAFTAAVLGGIGNLAGAVLGGILLGIIENIGAGYLGDLTHGFLGSQYKDIFAFLVLIIVLVLRPSGLLGERVADRA